MQKLLKLALLVLMDKFCLIFWFDHKLNHIHAHWMFLVKENICFWKIRFLMYIFFSFFEKCVGITLNDLSKFFFVRLILIFLTKGNIQNSFCANLDRCLVKYILCYCSLLIFFCLGLKWKVFYRWEQLVHSMHHLIDEWYFIFLHFYFYLSWFNKKK